MSLIFRPDSAGGGLVPDGDSDVSAVAWLVYSTSPIALAGTDPNWPAPDLDRAGRMGFQGRLGSSLVVDCPAGSPPQILVGLGDPPPGNPGAYLEAGAALARQVDRLGSKNDGAVLCIGPNSADPALAGPDPGGRLAPGARSDIELGFLLASYRFKVARGPSSSDRLAEAGISTRAQWLARATFMARDLANEPANRLGPEEMAGRIVEQFREQLEVQVFDEEWIAGEGLGALAAVGQGSHRPPRLVRLRYCPPGQPKGGKIALVGKGVTFDSGGLSLKSAEGMVSMKTDMSGAAAVVGAMSALAGLGCRREVVGWLPLAENMPGGGAIRPGDVVCTRAGKTVEILNTDAEGRLILADALALAVEEAPEAVVDIATLTGACRIALGTGIAGLFSNDDGLADAIRRAGDLAYEPLWRLPLAGDYRSQLESEVADLRNIGGPGGQAGAVTAALFLAEFVNDRPWVHLDIAGPARSDSSKGIQTKGATGFGARLLAEFCLRDDP
jgi:leucyl aminopeptidase